MKSEFAAALAHHELGLAPLEKVDFEVACNLREVILTLEQLEEPSHLEDDTVSSEDPKQLPDGQQR